MRQSQNAKDALPSHSLLEDEKFIDQLAKDFRLPMRMIGLESSVDGLMEYQLEVFDRDISTEMMGYAR